MSTDRRAGVVSTVFYLDGKRFSGYDAQAYLRDKCGFTDKEAIQYLVSLEVPGEKFRELEAATDGGTHE